MDLRKTALERAFELAQSGRCLNVSDINQRLLSETFDPVFSEGKALKAQLNSLIEEAKRNGSIS